jgi:hypothetical protein
VTKNRKHLYLAAISLLLFASQVGIAQKENKKGKGEEHDNAKEVLWHDPGDVGSLNLKYGIGGMDHVPDPNATYTFVEEDMNGTSPKLKVKDDHGVEWTAKMGAEPKSETAATRLMWAAGYFVDEDYYVATIKVKDLPKLRRGNEFVSNGEVRNVRLKRKVKGQKNLGFWNWSKNPFVDTREFNGLRVMMSLLNNWDLKDDNNAIYEVDGERRYVVKDLGASFGKTGNSTNRSKSNLKGYEDSSFIEKNSGDFVDFTMHSRPFFLTVFDVPNYMTRTDMEKITHHIPRADAKWLGQRLALLSDDQIRDCFQTAGYSPEEVAAYSEVVKKRIAALNAL